MDKVLELLTNHFRLIGAFAVLLCIVTWYTDIAGLVHECIYCRIQRTAIGLVGIGFMLPDPRLWWIRWLLVSLCFLGASVAADQLFLVAENVFAPNRGFGKLNLVMASGALGMLVGMAILLFTPTPKSTAG